MLESSSLIPSIISLCRFFVEQFPNISWYQNWYLGNPYYYLIGPIVPVLMYLMSYLSLSLFTGYFVLIALSIFIGSIGIFFFLRQYRINKYSAFIASAFYAAFPAIYLSLIYQNGLKHIAIAFIPIFLFVFKKYHKSQSWRLTVTLVCLASLSLLTNAASILTIIIGCLSLFFSFRNRKNGPEFLLKTIIVLLLAISLATLWYTLSYWYTILTNPSAGGIPLVKLIQNIFQSILQILPFVFAFFVVKRIGEKLSDIQKFSMLFIVSFFALSFIRFFLDPDFIMDWTGFIPELQMGGAFMVGSLRIQRRLLYSLLGICGFVTLFVMVQLLNLPAGRLGCSIVKIQQCSNRTIEQSNNRDVTYRTQITNLIKKHVPKTERIFLSGSPVFWINEEHDLMQVRGGNDSASIHPWWAHGAYQIREGKDAVLAAAWLKALGASYILVHDNKSPEPFRDFKNTRKYFDKKYFIRIDYKNGDYIYRVKDASIVRIVDRKILRLNSPQNGADFKMLNQYIQPTFKNVKNVQYTGQGIQFESTLNNDEILSLAFAFDSRWKLSKGEGTLVKDALGNIVIIPASRGHQEFLLRYHRNIFDWLTPLLSAVFFSGLLVRFNNIYPYCQKVFIKLAIGLREDEQDY